MELENTRDEYAGLGYGVCAISVDPVEVLADFARKRDIGYPLLSDADHEVIGAFGIINEEVPRDNDYYGMPHPGQYIIGPDRVVREKIHLEAYQNRVSQQTVLIEQFGWSPDTPAGRLETDFFTVEYRASETVVRPGVQIALIVDVKLKDRMHVYAPGVEGGYIPVSWQLEDSPRYEGLEVNWPEPEMIEFEALGQTLASYEGSFRFIQQVEIGGFRQLRQGGGEDAPLVDSLTVEGAFGFQACDDTKCYIPSEVELKFQFDVQGHPY